MLGASGYTGEEVVRLLALHPSFSVTVLTGETQAGKVRRMLTPFSSLGAPWFIINARASTVLILHPPLSTCINSSTT